ncbi:MAG: hypothetical protein WCA20_38770 [Candidatus Sulfotelmatobacter sp.]
MKFCKVSLFFALLVAVCLPAMGQTAMRVDIPFNFVAVGKSLPAGHYTVARFGTPSGQMWSISDNQNRAVMIINTNQADSSQKTHRSSLVFRQQGGTYSLTQIWNWDSGRDVPQAHVKHTLVSKDESTSDQYVEIAAE